MDTNTNTTGLDSLVFQRGFSPNLINRLNKAKHKGLTHHDALLHILSRVRGIAGVIGAVSENEGLMIEDVKEAAFNIRDEVELSILIIDDFLELKKMEFRKQQ